MKTEDISRISIEQSFTAQTSFTSFIRDYTDRSFEALYSQCKLKWQKMQCKPSKNRIRMFCIDKQCQKNIFTCQNEECDCFQTHKSCSKVSLVGLTQLLKTLSEYQKGFLKNLHMIQLDVVRKIEQSQKELMNKISYACLDQGSIDTLDIMTGKKIIENIIGSKASELYFLLKAKSKQKNPNEKQLSQMFKQISYKMADQNIQFKKRVLQSFLTNTKLNNVQSLNQQPFFLDSPILDACLKELYMSTPQYFQQKSYKQLGHLERFDVKKKAFDKKHLDFLKSSLYNPGRANLLYRASEHKFNVNKFHELCDGQTNTLTIIRTEYRKTIFAFSGAAAWNKSNSYVNDTSNRACILWLHPQNKLACSNFGNAIYPQATHGPWFGGNDLYIHNNGNVYTGFPAHYGTNFGSQSQQTYAQMIGCPNASSCKCIEYQVYQLVY